MMINLGENITMISIFHDDMQLLSAFMNESFLVLYYIWVLDRSENSNFIYSIIFFFLGKFGQIYFFKSVYLSI